MFKTSTIQISLGLIIAVALIMLMTMQDDVDSQSGATVIMDKKVVLPQDSDDYRIFVAQGLENFSVKYDDDFYRGGHVATIEGCEILKRYNVKTIISITPDPRERSLTKRYGFNLVELEFQFQTIPDELLQQFVTTINSGEGPFYVHCRGGSHRAGILALVYRVVKNGWTVERAVEEFVRLGGYPEKDKKLIDAARNFLKGLK